MIPLITAETTTSSKQESGERDSATNHGESAFAETMAVLGETKDPASGDDLDSHDSVALVSKEREQDNLPIALPVDTIGQASVEATVVGAVSDGKLNVGASMPIGGKDGTENALGLHSQRVNGEPDLSMDWTTKDKRPQNTDRVAASSPSNAQSIVEGLFPKSEQVKFSGNGQAGAMPDVNDLAKVRTFKDGSPQAYWSADTLKMELPFSAQGVAKLDNRWSDRPRLSSKSVSIAASVSIKANLASSLASTEIYNQFSNSHMISLNLPEGSNSIEALDRLTSLAVPGERTQSSAQMTGNAPATQGSEAARQVAGQIAIAARPGQATEISLSPEDLGKVRMSMTTADATITLNIAAERPETTELLRRHIEMLAQEFKALGFEDVSFSFDDQSRAESDAETLGAESGVSGEITNDDLPRPVEKTHQDSGLDLRL